MRGFCIRLRRRFFLLIFAVLPAAWPPAGVAADLMSQVKVAHQILNPSQGDTVEVSWQMTVDALVTLFICDLDGVIIRKLHQKTPFAAGAATVTWDGRDDDGRFCSNGAYIPIIRLKAKTGYQTYNPTAKPWGTKVAVPDTHYDADLGIITYRLEHPTLCLMRVGDRDGGPFFATLINWEPRPAGDQWEPWDGKDTHGLVDVAGRPDFFTMLDGIALPENSIMILGSPEKHSFQRWRQATYPLHPPSGGELFMHSLHQRRFCRDMAVEVAVDNRQIDPRSAIEVNENFSVQVDIPDRDHGKHLLRRGLEVYLFLDGVFLTEVKATTIPAQLEVALDQFSAGEHILTVNVRSFEDHAGTYSLMLRSK
jgi:hypothetical protein